MEPRILSERITPRQNNDKFKSADEELTYLREQVAQKERELSIQPGSFEQERLAKREITQYGDTPAAKILHETVVMPEHETMRQILKLEPEAHDKQLDGLISIVETQGVRNALSVAARLKNPHLEDDFHRVLVRYVAEGLPDSGSAVAEKVKRALHLVLFEVRPQAHGESGTKESGQQKLEQLLAPSEQLYSGLLSFIDATEGFSLEIAVPQGSESATLYLAVPRGKKTLAERLITSVFPNALVSESRGDYNIFDYEGAHAAAYATLAKHHALPIKTPDMFEHDPMNLLLAAFSKIAKHGEGAALQLVVGNEGDRYNHFYKKVIRELENGKSVNEALKVPETEIGEALRDVAKHIFSSNNKDDRDHHAVDKISMDEISRKSQTRVAPVSIRIVASAKALSRADEMINNLQSALNQYDNPHGNHFAFERVSSWGLNAFLHEFTFRTFDPSIAVPLSLAEINTIFHFTAERVTTSRELSKSHSKQAPAPIEMGDEGLQLGKNFYGADEKAVHFSPADRLRHCYVIGQTGTGKSGLLKSMIIQDIQNGEGVAFIDPHGNDIEDILASVPENRWNDVIYFDPAHAATPMGLNMLEYDTSKPEMKSFVIDEVYGVFRQLYSDVPEAFGPMFEQYYRNAVQLVVEDPATGCTFVEIPRVFADKAFRDLKISRCNNPIVVQFWRKIAEAAEGDAGLESIAPYITSKFDAFLSHDIMRPIVAQEKSAFNFRDIMDNKKIFLANLSKGRLGDKNAALLGLVIVSKYLQAAFSRADTKAVLPPHYLYIDEFQNFVTPSISTILSEARKYKLSLTVAHQFMAQLEDDIRDAVIGNVGTKIAMRVGTTDAEFLEKQFAPEFTAKDIEGLPNRTGIAAMLVNGSPARPFTIQTLNLPDFDHANIDMLKQMSYDRYGVPREQVEADIRRKFGITSEVPVRSPISSIMK
ncbi:MAG: TraM recognition domain-containing protein [Candidatus Pacebacteria bacterium]|nr:TraM recognition domain-containing protein [Candidatus Paceibacterota bacterium]